MFKSINIADDLHRDAVIASYRPTAKTLQIVRAVCGLEGGRATHVIAPYGSGKSIAALVAVSALTDGNEARQALIETMRRSDPEFSAALAATAQPNLAVVLHGACPDLAEALCQAAGLEAASELGDALAMLLKAARAKGAARIAIVWDEFGQHLETLVREGRSEDLLAVQNLAEWAVRRSEPTITFTTLMHRGVHHYTRRLSESAQSAWRKIEGRFDTLSLIEDGVDAVEMIAETLRGGRSGDCLALAKAARAVGFFDAFRDDEALARAIGATDPLTPAALDVLPRISGLVAQNERTMFRFLDEVVALAQPKQPVGLPDLYDWFAPAMQADTGAGGTHRRLVEAEAALSRVETGTERAVVKAAALLQFGPSGERTRLPLSRLVFGLSSGEQEVSDAVEAAIARLIERKVLLHRRRADDVSLWHGADVDLGALIAEEVARLDPDLDIPAELERLFPPDAYVAPAYNFRRAMTRFARASYVRASELSDAAGREALIVRAAKEDALVALVIDGVAGDPLLHAACAHLPPHLLVALPRRMTEAGETLAGLRAVDTLLGREELIASDPMVARELHELRADAEISLRHALDRLMNPDRGDVIWLCGSAEHDFADGRDAGSVLAEIFERRFPDTPVIRNEQVVRRRVTAVSRSARKRCILAVIERSGSPSLGYEAATSADASIYRTVFEATGLYRPRGGIWGWASPDELSTDPGLKAVWTVIHTFFSQPEDTAKRFDSLLDELSASPIGLREGVAPLLIAAGMQAFARSVALREIGEVARRYVDDIQPTVIEDICAAPQKYELEVSDLSAAQTANLEAMIQELVGVQDHQEPDLLRCFYDAVLERRRNLPPTALNTPGLGPNADLLQPLLRRRGLDPLALLRRDLPRVLDEAALSDKTVAIFSKALCEMEAVTESFAMQAAEIAHKVFNGRLRSKPLPLLEAAQAWGVGVPVDLSGPCDLSQEARGVLSRARSAAKAPRGELGFVAILSAILSGHEFKEWDDSRVEIFRAQLQSAVDRVEDYALSRAEDSEVYAPFLKNSIENAFRLYCSKLGREKMMRYLKDIYESEE